MTDDLIARIKQAECPSYALECEIADFVWESRWARKRPKDIRAEPVTASLDAALRLLPPDSTWHVSGGPLGGYVAIESGDDRVRDFTAHAATPALAMCAASLTALRKP